MTSDETPQDPYAGTPYYGPPATQPGYGRQGYGQPTYGQPGYPPQAQPAYYPGQQYPGYPPPGYPPYPPYYPAPAGKPGTVTASAVLAFVSAGLLIAAALLLFLGASVLRDIGDVTSSSTFDPTSTEFSIDAMVNLASAALLITGGVMITGRKLNGRTMITLGGGIVIASSIYWLFRFSDFGSTIFYALMFAALSVISICMGFTESARTWLGSGPAKAQPQP